MGKNTSISSYDSCGKRKYLIASERVSYLTIANTKEDRKQLFLLMLLYSGARISEVLHLTPQQIDGDENVVVIASLKKRKTGIFRSIPLPNQFLKKLLNCINQLDLKANEDIWPIDRRTGYRWVMEVMEETGIVGPQACSRGLRHSFAINALEHDVPLHLIKNWMDIVQLK